LLWDDLISGIAFYLIIEGLFPFVSPKGWKGSLIFIGKLNDQKLRRFGFLLIFFGLIILFFIRS
tara:strand:+ start:1173 stop:1364 length:192 start_codon:yes stop_codon:yes gene_type:complete